MTVLPINIARVPNLLSQRLSLSNLGRTSLSLLDVQTQLATGRQINRPSDDSVKASAISVLDDRLAVAQQRNRNLSHATSVLDTLDTSIGGITDLVRQAQTIASSQVGVQSDAQTRSQQAVVVDSLISSLLNAANGSTAGVHYFGGSTPGQPPVSQTSNGYRFTARGSGLFTDLGPPPHGNQIPITLGGNNAIGETSARLRSTLDLNPSIRLNDPLSELRGARGRGINLGTVSFQFGAGPSATVDLQGAQNVQEVVNKLSDAIGQYETANSVTILAPGGVTVNGSSLRINVVPPPPGPSNLTFTDLANNTTAADLGLTLSPFNATTPNSQDLDPKLSLNTQLSSISSLTVPLGSIRLRQTNGAGSSIRDVNLSTAQTVDDVRNLIEGAGVNARVLISDDGRSLSVLSENAGTTLSIEEVAGNNSTATQLGIRSLSTSTLIADFNAGRGARIIDNRVNPATQLVDRATNVDFRVTLGNGQFFDVDLRPQDIANVGTVLARITSEFTAAVGTQNNTAAPAIGPADLAVGLTDGSNGLAFTQSVGPGAVTISQLNNSPASEELGLSSLTQQGATFVAQDRAGIRVDNLFSDLLDLRDALLRNDSAGITIAGERLTSSGDRVTQAQALVGTYSRRVTEASERLEDQRIVDLQLKSNLQDTDYAEAATRFSLLQTQLQASLQTTAQFQSRTLLDFLG